jgi:hypothetical protein
LLALERWDDAGHFMQRLHEIREGANLPRKYISLAAIGAEIGNEDRPIDPRRIDLLAELL